MSSPRQALIPSLTYRDPRAAIVFLGAAFGFETVMLLEDSEGALVHAEVQLDGLAISLGSEWGEHNRSPLSVGGMNTQATSIHIIDGIDAHCARARAAGADVFAEPETQFYGDRTYRCRDPEGHVWTVAQRVAEVSREDAEASTGLKITGWT